MILSASGYAHQIQRSHTNTAEQEYVHSKPEHEVLNSIEFSRVDIQWVNSNPDVQINESNPTTRIFNYYNLPHNPKGITGVKEFQSVLIGNIYPGIDVRFYDADGLFEHDYEIAPGADYRDIQIEISGTTPRLNSAGELVLSTPLGTITESSPIVFQNGEELQSKWIQIDENVWGFDVPDANPELVMIIDPVSRVWGTYYGGSNLDEIYYCKMNQWGNLYTAGASSSTTNIATVGTEQVTLDWGKDAVLARFDEDGNHIWGTYIGGNGTEESWGLDVDATGNIYVIGRTESTNNFTTPGCHQEIYGGGIYDGFIQKLDADGIREWGTYYGGDNDDRCRFVHVSEDGFIYVTGATTSPTNISTPGSYKEVFTTPTNDLNNDAFLVKFSGNGNRIWGTYFGGVMPDQGFSCDTDSDSNIYMFGHAQSETDVSTPGAHQPTHGGGLWDAFFSKFTADGDFVWATYVGGSQQERSWTCSINESDEIFITGRTESPNNIATPGAHQEIIGGNYDAYLMKFTTDGTREWGTYLGGTQYDHGYGCVGLDDGKIMLSGHTESNNGISTSGSHQEIFGGGIDAFLSIFNGDGELQSSTYYGGTSDDVGRSSTWYEGAYYIAGWTKSDMNISTAGIHQEEYGGSQDGFIAKFIDCQNSFNEIEVMSCDTFVAPDGEIYYETGEYTAVLSNSNNCDSIITINLTISNIHESEQEIHLCQETSYELPDGTVVIEDGEYTILFDGESDCDSIVNYSVSFHPEYSEYSEITACANDPVSDHLGNEITVGGIHILEFESIYGCDSTVTLDLTYLPISETEVNILLCSGESMETPIGMVSGGGSYIYPLTASNGCDSIILLNVEMIPAPVAAFSTDPDMPTDIYHNNIQFFNESMGADSITWNFYDFGLSDTENPMIVYGENPGEYDVCLTAYAGNGCSDQYCQTLAILEDFAVYIPNSFTPNGDGINDLFFVDGYGMDPDDFLMRVFNRWGEVVFESNDRLKKWDGAEPARTHYAQNEIYTYQVIVGALHYTDKKEITGRVTVIR